VGRDVDDQTQSSTLQVPTGDYRSAGIKAPTASYIGVSRDLIQLKVAGETRSRDKVGTRSWRQ